MSGDAAARESRESSRRLGTAEEGRMPQSSQAALRQLSALASRVNAASDELTRSISAIETSLNSYGLGIEEFADLPDEVEHEDLPPTKRTLWYEKIGNRWGLYLHSWQDPSSAQDVTVLSRLSREQRVLVVQALPELLEKIVNRVESLEKSLTAAQIRAQEIVSQLPRVPENSLEITDEDIPF